MDEKVAQALHNLGLDELPSSLEEAKNDERDARDNLKHARKEKDNQQQIKHYLDELQFYTTIRKHLQVIAAGNAGLTYKALMAEVPKKRITTPSKEDDKTCHLLGEGFADFEKKKPPMIVEVEDGYSNCFDPIELSPDERTEQQGDADLFQESTYYPLASTDAPTWIAVEPRDPSITHKKSAGDVFKPISFDRRRIIFSKRIEPEIFAAVKDQDKGKAAFNAELKSAGSGRTAIEECAQYTTLGMIHSCFSKTTELVFYENPPVGFAVLGMGNVGYIVVLEWIAKVFLTPWSVRPFFFGSEEQSRQMQLLQPYPVGESVPFDPAASRWNKCQQKGIEITTTSTPIDGYFWKIIECAAFPAPFFRNLYMVYSRLSKISSGELKAHNLLPAQLLFGEFAVAVRMEFVEDASHPNSWTEEEALQEAIADAVVFLAKHELIYVDLRLPNVLRKEASSSSEYCLVDYDDMLPVDQPVLTYAAFEKHVFDYHQESQEENNFLAHDSYGKLKGLIMQKFLLG